MPSINPEKIAIKKAKDKITKGGIKKYIFGACCFGQTAFWVPVFIIAIALVFSVFVETSPADEIDTPIVSDGELAFPVEGLDVANLINQLNTMPGKRYMAPRRGGRIHAGVDIGAPNGTNILSATDGVVKYAGGGLNTQNGNVHVVSGDKAYVYYHPSAFLVKAGDTVTKGQAIARVGWSHLHFSIKDTNIQSHAIPFDETMNPMLLLNPGGSECLYNGECS